MLARRLHPFHALAWGLAVLIAVCPIARAAAPPALVNPDFAFPLPGDFVTPANAASAGLALADRWLGTTGFENPAATLPRGLELSPLFQRVSRQDISSQNRDFEQVTGYPDAAGARYAMAFRQWGITLYAWQPVLRLEEFSYSAGPLATPAFQRLLTSQREIRAGGSVSHAAGVLRIGLAGEYVRRDDSYETHEQSGDPSAGDRLIDMGGDGFGVSGGVSWEKDVDRPWGSWFGAALRYGSELTMTGTADERLALGDTTYDFTATRDVEWSGGVSGRVTIAPATRFVAGLSVRSGADWKGLDIGTTTGASWSAGFDWKDPELPWGARFGVGQEKNPGAVEEKAGLLSVGFTWVSGDLVLDAGILHRNLAHGDLPRSSDDRIVASVRIAL